MTHNAQCVSLGTHHQACDASNLFLMIIRKRNTLPYNLSINSRSVHVNSAPCCWKHYTYNKLQYCLWYDWLQKHCTVHTYLNRDKHLWNVFPGTSRFESPQKLIVQFRTLHRAKLINPASSTTKSCAYFAGMIFESSYITIPDCFTLTENLV